jgi:hypothetical protein
MAQKPCPEADLKDRSKNGLRLVKLGELRERRSAKTFHSRGRCHVTLTSIDFRFTPWVWQLPIARSTFYCMRLPTRHAAVSCKRLSPKATGRERSRSDFAPQISKLGFALASQPSRTTWASWCSRGWSSLQRKASGAGIGATNPLCATCCGAYVPPSNSRASVSGALVQIQAVGSRRDCSGSDTQQKGGTVEWTSPPLILQPPRAPSGGDAGLARSNRQFRRA